MEENNQYSLAVSQIKQAILKSQYQAVKGVNAIQLSLYYGVGKYISENTRKKNWGTGALKTISSQLNKQLPGLRGFSETNMRYMRLFYESWKSMPTNSSATADELPPSSAEGVNPFVLISVNSSAVADEFNLEEFLSISFTHHCEILSKAKTIEERIFYIHQTFIHQWDKYSLRDYLKAKLYEHRGEMPNNFLRTIPNKQSALKAIEMFKDEYLLDFINVEEIGERDKEDIDERVVEKAIVHNVKNFIMTFGHDFTFVGNQYHLEAYQHDFYPDLLFFNRELNALVCVELKIGTFKPAYLGQLTAYLRILDDKVKKAHENPSIGIVLCKEADMEFVQYVIQDYNKPMGVATYTTTEEMPDRLRKALPDLEKLKKLIE